MHPSGDRVHRYGWLTRRRRVILGRYADGPDTESGPPTDTDTVHGVTAFAAFAAIPFSTALRFRIASIAGIFNGTRDLRPKL